MMAKRPSWRAEQPASGLLATLDDDMLLCVVKAVVVVTSDHMFQSVRVSRNGVAIDPPPLPTMACLFALANLSRSCKRMRDMVRCVETCIDASRLEFDSSRGAIQGDDNDLQQRFLLERLTGGLSMPLVLPSIQRLFYEYGIRNHLVEGRHGPGAYMLHIVRDCDPNVSRTNERPYGKPYVFLTVNCPLDRCVVGMSLSLAHGLALFSGAHVRKSILSTRGGAAYTTGLMPWRTSVDKPTLSPRKLGRSSPHIRVKLRTRVNARNEMAELLLLTFGPWDGREHLSIDGNPIVEEHEGAVCAFNDSNPDVAIEVPMPAVRTLQGFFNAHWESEELVVCRFEGTSPETYRSMIDWSATYSFARERRAL